MELSYLFFIKIVARLQSLWLIIFVFLNHRPTSYMYMSTITIDPYSYVNLPYIKADLNGCIVHKHSLFVECLTDQLPAVCIYSRANS